MYGQHNSSSHILTKENTKTCSFLHLPYSVNNEKSHVLSHWVFTIQQVSFTTTYSVLRVVQLLFSIRIPQLIVCVSGDFRKASQYWLGAYCSIVGQYVVMEDRTGFALQEPLSYRIFPLWVPDPLVPVLADSPKLLLNYSH
jgi:hypothetical protein